MRRLIVILLSAITGIIVIEAARSFDNDSTVVVAARTADNDSTIIAAPTDTATSTQPRTRRFVTPVNNAATRTQHVNDARGDSARIIERRRARSIQYLDNQGRTVMVDTLTGQEWVDSTLLPAPPKMLRPLLYTVEIGVNIWDPVMRIFGQKYGGIDFSAALNLHNRYLPTFEAGFGMAKKTPAGMNFTYRSPLAPYFKLGADYNFIYNSDPDYRFTAGFRYGFSSFKYSIENVTINDSYWDEVLNPEFPDATVTAGWFELVLGMRVKIAGPISAGWAFRYHSILHRSHPVNGDAWYIPGYGSSTSSLSGSFSIVYSLGLSKENDTPVDIDTGEDLPAAPLPADAAASESTSTNE